MVNVNGKIKSYNESTEVVKNEKLTVDCNNLIWTMKAIDCMNEENQENMSRVHVLCCNKCDFLTISLKSLEQHMVLLHSLSYNDFNNLTIYSCQECKCVSTELKLIQEHIKIFHNISTENSSNSSTSDKITKKTTILTPSIGRNSRKPQHIKLVKNQLKMRKKILQRKSLKIKTKNCLPADIDTGDNNNNLPQIKSEIKKENIQYNERVEISQNIDENDPLDMSINSLTCPFKGFKCEFTDCNNFPYPTKQESTNNENFDSINNNYIANNPLFTNPQTCIELIKLTLNQMLNKSTEQNHLSHIGFNPTSFLQSQFQFSSNIVPLLLPTSTQAQNNIQNQPQNEMSFASKGTEIEAILANIQQQNILKSVSPKTFEQNNQIVAYQKSPLYLNHKLTGSSSNVTKCLYIDNSQKNGNPTISPLSTYNSKKSNEFHCKTPNKRSLKKQPVPTKIRNNLKEELGYLPKIKFDSPKGDSSKNENLFNRTFLDSSELENTNEQADLSKILENHDNIDCNTNFSNKSSPNTHDKQHRQNFTSQQNRILSDWFFTHCDKPYPSTEDTKELSQLSGLTYSQVKKWFANKRARSSLNKKNHKNYCLINPTESTMDEMANRDICSLSPSSDSHKSYNNTVDVTAAIDFTTYIQEKSDKN